MSWSLAQRWCNFVLLEPTTLPAGVELVEATMRPEAPPGRLYSEDSTTVPQWTRSNRCAHRCVLAGGNRSVRVKQFLYDYAPPAFDHPCLWESRSVRPFEVGNHIGWCGVDFRKRPGATVNLHRTTVEFSVLSGRFKDEEFQSLCEGMEPVDPDACHRIAYTPLAMLCYQHRHAEPPIAVPVGYLAHKRWEGSRVAALTPGETPEELLDWLPRIAREAGFRLDSAFVFGDPHHPTEVDFALFHEHDRGRYLRVLVSPASAPHGVPYPPRREERQRCQVRSIALGGQVCVHAFATARYGQHEAVWQNGKFNIMLMAKPQRWTTIDWFHALLRDVIR